MNNSSLLHSARSNYYNASKNPQIHANVEYQELVVTFSEKEYAITILEELNTIKECVINRTVYHTHLNRYDLSFLKSINPYKYSSVREIGELYSYFKIYKANYLYETKSRVELQTIVDLASKGLEYLRIPIDIVIWNNDLKKLINIT